jgi:hypothetical protein
MLPRLNNNLQYKIYTPQHRLLLVPYVVTIYCGAVSRNFDVGTDKLIISYIYQCYYCVKWLTRITINIILLCYIIIVAIVAHKFPSSW